MKYQIRPMTIEDITDVIRGEEVVFGESLGYDMLYTDLTLNPYACYLVLDIDGAVRGYLGLWINDNAEIINFYIDEAYRHQGFGQMLLDFAINLCQMSKVEYLSLEVRPSNTQAIKLYEKCGFTSSHRRSAYYANGEDAIVMIKKFEVIR